MAGQRRDNLVDDGFDIERIGQCSHAPTLSEVAEGTMDSANRQVLATT
jgi:hypothetical protein